MTETAKRKVKLPDVLAALVAQVCPSLAKQATSGQWGPNGAPYTFQRLGPDRVRLTIENPETGDRVGVIGTSNRDAIAQMVARLNHKQAAAKE